MPMRFNGLKAAMLMLDAGKGQLPSMAKVFGALKRGATDVVGSGYADGFFQAYVGSTLLVLHHYQSS